MHVEQSTLSRRILVLEQALGFPLFKVVALPDTYSGLYAVSKRDSKSPYILPFRKLLRAYYNA